MGMESQTKSRPTAPASADATVDVVERSLSQQPALQEPSQEEIEQIIEADESLIPTRPSAFLVEPAVLAREELDALLDDLGPMLAAAAELGAGQLNDSLLEGAAYESDPQANRCDRRDK